ncbi:hypothetical protein KJ359_012749 [Pestalotiopsis sp. 9143b]|nr:hypothetical protein KJ359_012749 [Pestalotiopsis sp. 9143b]
MLLHSLIIFASIPLAFARVQFLGVAIAGGDFGCQIDGTCPTSSVQFAGDAADQISHFVGEGMNLMRIPTSWQFLVNNQLGGNLNSSNLAKYDQLIQACLSTGSYCMIDIHNFARWNGGIIGQGGPSDDQFVSLWTQLASKYAADDKIVFEVMNEPHDLDIDLWAQTCQKVVMAIRNSGATSQMILLPGTNFDSAATLVSSGSADKMMAITNPDGSTDGLVLDIHKYLDEDNSGTHEECVTDNVDAFTGLAQYLRDNGRQGLISESGASSDASCLTNFCSQNAFINQNSDFKQHIHSIDHEYESDRLSYNNDIVVVFVVVIAIISIYWRCLYHSLRGKRRSAIHMVTPHGHLAADRYRTAYNVAERYRIRWYDSHYCRDHHIK